MKRGFQENDAVEMLNAIGQLWIHLNNELVEYAYLAQIDHISQTETAPHDDERLQYIYIAYE